MEYLGLEYFVDANKRIYYIYILSSLAIAALYLYFYPKQKRINCSLKLWLHPSAKLDYSYFFIANIIKVLMIYPLVLSAKSIAISVLFFMQDSFGYIRVDMPYVWVMLLYSTTLFVFSDFTRYILHRLLHSVPFLWEFHKVHHSAKVLTPITFYRVHPIENILFGFRYALSIGLVTGLFIYLFGSKVGLFEIIGVNGLIFIFSLLGSNLRHSHIKFQYPKVLEAIFISPYMHQIHHSTKYYNRNFGGYLSIWDKVFNSLKYSSEVKTIQFGLSKNEMQNYNTIVKLLFMPMVKLFKKTQWKERWYEIFRIPRSTSSYFNNWM